MFSEAGKGQDSLRRVLCAYSLYDEEVGYCQGLGFITAMFLTYMPEEEVSGSESCGDLADSTFRHVSAECSNADSKTIDATYHSTDYAYRRPSGSS